MSSRASDHVVLRDLGCVTTAVDQAPTVTVAAEEASSASARTTKAANSSRPGSMLASSSKPTFTGRLPQLLPSIVASSRPSSTSA